MENYSLEDSEWHMNRGRGAGGGLCHLNMPMPLKPWQHPLILPEPPTHPLTSYPAAPLLSFSPPPFATFHFNKTATLIVCAHFNPALVIFFLYFLVTRASSFKIPIFQKQSLKWQQLTANFPRRGAICPLQWIPTTKKIFSTQAFFFSKWCVLSPQNR